MAQLPRSLDDQFLEAAERGDAERGRLLLAQGANPSAKRADNGFSALMLAAGAGCDPLVKELVDRGAPAGGHHVLTALHVAAREGHAGCVRLLLPVSNPEASHPLDGLALHLAAQKGSADCVRLLASRKTAKALDAYGCTPLMRAASGSPEAFEALLPFSALSVKASNGSTALSLLAYSALSQHSNDASRAGRWRAVLERAWLLAKPSEQNTALKALLGQTRWRELIELAELATAEQLESISQGAKKGNFSHRPPPASFLPQLKWLATRAGAMAEARQLGEAVARAMAQTSTLGELDQERSAQPATPSVSRPGKRRL